MRLIWLTEIREYNKLKSKDIIDRFLEWDIIPEFYFKSLEVAIVVKSSDSNSMLFESRLESLLNKVNNYSEWLDASWYAKIIWKWLDRYTRYRCLLDLIMVDSNIDKVIEETKMIFWDNVSKDMIDVILNHIDMDGNFNF